jgi:hypothetical protein
MMYYIICIDDFFSVICSPTVLKKVKCKLDIFNCYVVVSKDKKKLLNDKYNNKKNDMEQISVFNKKNLERGSLFGNFSDNLFQLAPLPNSHQ